MTSWPSAPALVRLLGLPPWVPRLWAMCHVGCKVPLCAGRAFHVLLGFSVRGARGSRLQAWKQSERATVIPPKMCDVRLAVAGVVPTPPPPLSVPNPSHHCQPATNDVNDSMTSGLYISTNTQRTLRVIVGTTTATPKHTRHAERNPNYSISLNVHAIVGVVMETYEYSPAGYCVPCDPARRAQPHTSRGAISTSPRARPPPRQLSAHPANAAQRRLCVSGQWPGRRSRPLS